MTHTPGPWYVDETRNISSFAVVPESPTEAVHIVCACRCRHRRTDHFDEALANARLIAAAPNLLAELQRAETKICDLIAILRQQGLANKYAENDWLKDIRAAIAKATQ